MTNHVPSDVVEYFAKVAEWLKSAPEGKYAEGSLYIGEVPVRWYWSGCEEEFGRFVPNDFDGYDLIPEHKNSAQLKEQKT